MKSTCQPRCTTVCKLEAFRRVFSSRYACNSKIGVFDERANKQATTSTCKELLVLGQAFVQTPPMKNNSLTIPGMPPHRPVKFALCPHIPVTSKRMLRSPLATSTFHRVAAAISGALVHGFHIDCIAVRHHPNVIITFVVGARFPSWRIV